MGFVARFLTRHTIAFQTTQLNPSRTIVRTFADDGIAPFGLVLVESDTTPELHFVSLLFPTILQGELIVGIRTYHRIA